MSQGGNDVSGSTVNSPWQQAFGGNAGMGSGPLGSGQQQGGYGQGPPGFPSANCNEAGMQIGSGALLISVIASLCVCGLCIFVCGFWRWASSKKQFKYGKLSQEEYEDDYADYPAQTADEVYEPKIGSADS